MPSTPEYRRSYYLSHKEQLKKKHREWYLKNRSYCIAKQVIYNRKTRKAKRAARAGQKPVRKKVYSVSTADTDSPRNTAPISRAKQPGARKHGNAVRVVSSGDTPSSLSPLNDGLSAPQAEMVSAEIQESNPE